jgi:hypothetical protein
MRIMKVADEVMILYCPSLMLISLYIKQDD